MCRLRTLHSSVTVNNWCNHVDTRRNLNPFILKKLFIRLKPVNMKKTTNYPLILYRLSPFSYIHILMIYIHIHINDIFLCGRSMTIFTNISLSWKTLFTHIINPLNYSIRSLLWEELSLNVIRTVINVALVGQDEFTEWLYS